MSSREKAILDRILGDLGIEVGKCPECGSDDLEEIEPWPADPECGVGAYRGGVACLNCDWEAEAPDTTPDPATEAKYRREGF
jgi:hypothetical protein